MEIAHLIGGVPAVTGVLTIPTGIIGAVTGPYVLDPAGIRTPEARGFALAAQATASRSRALSARVKSWEALRAWAWRSTPS
jgi:putative effector of murein hydrolase